MKSLKIFSVLVVLLMTVTTVFAQPTKSRVRENAEKTDAKNPASRIAKKPVKTGTNSSNNVNVDRASIMFPSAVTVPDDPSWRRDIYRSLDLTKDQNAPLYFPVQPQGDKVNLFTLLFQLLNEGKIPAYEYKLDGVEDFNKANRMHFKDMLDRQGIFYEVQGNSIKVNASDIPSEEVTLFFIKESTYYDQNTATFHSRVTALCPVLQRADDFGFDDGSMSFGGGGGDSTDVAEDSLSIAEPPVSNEPVAKRNTPLFWVKMDDIAPYLSQHMIMISNYNNAAQCSMADFFDTNKYKGTIYMTTNMQNRMLQQDFTNEKALKKEQDRIEKQLSDFEKNLWETPVDSAAQAKKDSIAALKNTKKSKSPSLFKGRGSKASKDESGSAGKSESGAATKTEKVKVKKEKSSGGSTPRVSARRQRH